MLTLLLRALVATATATLFQPAPVAAQPAGGIRRTVFISVADRQHRWVTDLTAEDLIVKERGKVCVVQSATQGAGLLRIALLIEPSLLGDTNVHSALSQFVGKMQGRAEIGLVTAGPRDRTIIAYTKDAGVLTTGISRLSQVRDPGPDHLGEGIFETARAQMKSETRHRAVIALGIDRDQIMNMQAQEVLDELQHSGVMLFVASVPGPMGTMPVGDMADASGLSQVLGDGPKQSGGRREQVTITAGFPDVLKAFADELLHQYEVVYLLPAGTKPDNRLSVTTTRRDVFVRAPSRVPNR